MPPLEAPLGFSIHRAAQWAAGQALASGLESVEMVFNDLVLTVYWTSHPNDIATIYFLKHELRRRGVEL